MFLLILAAYPGYALEAEGRSTSSYGTYPTWSPDGMIAYQGSDYNIWVMQSDGTGRRLIIDDIYRDEQPAFSPDGKMIAYVSERNGLQELWVMTAEGDGRRQLTTSTGWKHSPTWSPDGTRIAYIVSPQRNGKGDVWMFDLATDDTLRLTEDGNARSVAWNPRDGRLAYLSVKGGYDIRLLDPETGYDELLLEDTYWKGQLAWSPDGKKIAFVSYREGNYDLWLLEDGEMERITSEKSWQVSPAWSPDGTKIAYSSDENGVYEIWVKGIDVIPLTTVMETPAEVVAPAEVPIPEATPEAETIAEKSAERSVFEEKAPVLQLEMNPTPNIGEIPLAIDEPDRDFLPMGLAALASILIVELVSRSRLRIELANKRSVRAAY